MTMSRAVVFCAMWFTVWASNPSHYNTVFNNSTTVLRDWTLENDCTHCSSNHAGECTQMTPHATTFGSSGMVHTTTKADPSKSSCGALSNSGHATWNPHLLYGNFTVVARWFPGGSKNVSTATGFIGLDANNNVASITMVVSRGVQ
eukprot:Hpha_TRINITY_DN4679_c0_g1::TRINITY_DN4679_c0_g1_i1::g.97074::m.97074